MAKADAWLKLRMAALNLDRLGKCPGSSVDPPGGNVRKHVAVCAVLLSLGRIPAEFVKLVSRTSVDNSAEPSHEPIADHPTSQRPDSTAVRQSLRRGPWRWSRHLIDLPLPGAGNLGLTLDALTGAFANGLRRRGTRENTPLLASQDGPVLFRTAYKRWLEADV